MTKVVVARSAQADLQGLILTHSLPSSTRERVRSTLRLLESFPLIGPALGGRWLGFRFLLGQWPWMLVVYVYDEPSDQVSVVAIRTRDPLGRQPRDPNQYRLSPS